MKKLTLIAHTHGQQKLSDRLQSMDRISRFTFTHEDNPGNDIENGGQLQ